VVLRNDSRSPPHRSNLATKLIKSREQSDVQIIEVEDRLRSGSGSRLHVQQGKQKAQGSSSDHEMESGFGSESSDVVTVVNLDKEPKKRRDHSHYRDDSDSDGSVENGFPADKHSHSRASDPVFQISLGNPSATPTSIFSGKGDSKSRSKRQREGTSRNDRNEASSRSSSSSSSKSVSSRRPSLSIEPRGGSKLDSFRVRSGRKPLVVEVADKPSKRAVDNTKHHATARHRVPRVNSSQQKNSFEKRYRTH